MLGKNRLKKLRKHVFHIHINIVTKKWGGKKARKNFSRNTRIVPAEKLRKNRLKKVRKHLFLYSHEYRDKKMGEKTRKTIFPETHE